MSEELQAVTTRKAWKALKDGMRAIVKELEKEELEIFFSPDVELLTEFLVHPKRMVRATMRSRFEYEADLVNGTNPGPYVKDWEACKKAWEEAQAK